MCCTIFQPVSAPDQPSDPEIDSFLKWAATFLTGRWLSIQWMLIRRGCWSFGEFVFSFRKNKCTFFTWYVLIQQPTIFFILYNFLQEFRLWVCVQSVCVEYQFIHLTSRSLELFLSLKILWYETSTASSNSKDIFPIVLLCHVLKTVAIGNCNTF